MMFGFGGCVQVPWLLRTPIGVPGQAKLSRSGKEGWSTSGCDQAPVSASKGTFAHGDRIGDRCVNMGASTCSVVKVRSNRAANHQGRGPGSAGAATRRRDVRPGKDGEEEARHGQLHLPSSSLPGVRRGPCASFPGGAGKHPLQPGHDRSCITGVEGSGKCSGSPPFLDGSRP